MPGRTVPDSLVHVAGLAVSRSRLQTPQSIQVLGRRRTLFLPFPTSGLAIMVLIELWREHLEGTPFPTSGPAIIAVIELWHEHFGGHSEEGKITETRCSSDGGRKLTGAM